MPRGSEVNGAFEMKLPRGCAGGCRGNADLLLRFLKNNYVEKTIKAKYYFILNKIVHETNMENDTIFFKSLPSKSPT